MSVRFKLALTIFVTGALTAIGVIAAVIFAFQRFEHETLYYRSDAFLGRVVAMYDNAGYDDIFDMHDREPAAFEMFLRNLVLFEPDAQLYLLDPEGTVLASTGSVKLKPGFKVHIEPVRSAIGSQAMPYVMGDDPERMDADAVIAARAVRRKAGGDAPPAGYLYLVAHSRSLLDGDPRPASEVDRPPSRTSNAAEPHFTGSPLQVIRSSVAEPAMIAIIGIVLLATLLAAWVIAAVTRPLRQLTDAMAIVSSQGVEDQALDAAEARLPSRSSDEFGQLTGAFAMMLATCRRQWSALRELDQFRREGVSNLSHDLRSPLTATVACLETLEGRWQARAAPEPSDDGRGNPSTDGGPIDDLRLVEVALRNTRNAARLVKSLGDLAQLDEPAFRLKLERIDSNELLDDIAMRFAERGARAGITVRSEASVGLPAVALIDVELFERAIANLVDNALKFGRPGDQIVLSARVVDSRIEVDVADSGPGIDHVDLPHLFDRFHRSSVAPATGEGGKGLGLAIVKRIAELHGGTVEVTSSPGCGTMVRVGLPTTLS